MEKANKLFTKTAFRKVPKLYATGTVPADKKVALVKIFSIRSDHRHYVIEYDPKTGLAFCLTTNGDVCEFGFVSITEELQEINDNFRQHGFRCPPFEREMHGPSYNIAKVQEAHSRTFNPEAWEANEAETIPV